MKKLSKFSLIVLLSSTICWLSVVPSLAQVRTTDTFVEYLRYLASDEMKGRGNGSPELEQAARYIAELFRDFGLLPAGDEQTYFQEFELGLARSLGPENQVTFETGSEQIRLQVQKDYVPLTSGPDTVVQGPLVFAGFGISAPELNYDDYKDLDVGGKIVLVFEHEPQEQVKDSLFAGKELTPYATVLHKIVNAKERGAVGVILLSDSFNHPQGQEQQPRRPVEVEDMGIPSLRLTQEWSERLLQQSGHDPVEIADKINSRVSPISFDLGFSAVVSLEVVRVRRTVRNVLGFVPGQTDSVIVLGAHYDHLGLGIVGSLAPEARGQVHNGADDNASGTAGLLQLAQELGRSSSLKQGLLFIAFAGEELGLLGSRYYTEHPTIPLEKTTAMINMDMIGRSEGDLLIGGVRTTAEFSRILDEVQKSSPLQFSYSDDLRGSSDHLSFSGRKIPVLFFFSGLHSDYHRPSDDWERINVETTGQILDVVRSSLDRLLELNQPLPFVEVDRRSNRATRGGRQRRPWFGSLPDMSWRLGGVRFEQILSDTPAAEAGLKDGDVLVLFDGRTIDNLRQFLAALEAKSPGDEVEVAVFRKGELIRTTVRMATRAR
ncbi:MAG: M28 family peptidase [Acidobacteria bacterium]|nr:M28 family peptidase [Acidobacteriota bacterium]